MREAKGVWAQPTEGLPPEESGFEKSSNSNRHRVSEGLPPERNAFSMRDANRVWAQPTAKRAGCGHSPLSP